MHGPPWLQAEFFRDRGLRFTLPRQVILETLFKTRKHLSAEDIYFRIHPLYPHIGLSTVYRTLELLNRIGLVSKFDFGDGRARYEFVRPGENSHHHHLICSKCGRIIDYSDFVEKETHLIKEIENTLSKKYNFVINSHQIHFYGLCEDCKNERR